MTNLAPIEVAAVTCESDLIRCVPYSAVLAAGVCAERQTMHGVSMSISASGRLQPERKPTHATRIRNYGRCRSGMNLQPA